MITNLLAAVTVAFATNVVESFSDYESYAPLTHPRLRIVTTTVTRSAVLTFDWLGKQRTVTEPQGYTVTVQYFRKQPEQWVETSPTNTWNGIWITNGTTTTFIPDAHSLPVYTNRNPANRHPPPGPHTHPNP